MIPSIGNMSFFDVVDVDGQETYDYWKTTLTAVIVQTQHATQLSLSKSKIKASKQPIVVFDTGTTLILGPSKDVGDLWTLIGGAQQSTDGTWQVRCDLGVIIGFQFGNMTYYLDPSDISWDGKSSDGWCMAGIQSNDMVSLVDHSL